jgi:hypothetical protein
VDPLFLGGYNFDTLIKQQAMMIHFSADE